MRLLLIDDHQLVRDVLIEYIRESLGAEVVPANSQDEAVEIITSEGPFSCVLADLRMPGVRSAFDLKAIVTANEPKPVLLFSGVATFSDLFAAQSIGMAGFVRKDMPAPELVKIIAAIENDPENLPEEIGFTRHMKARPDMPNNLSAEDCLILGMVADGARNSEIASGLGFTRSHVENRLRKIYRSIGVSSRLAAANYVNAKVV